MLLETVPHTTELFKSKQTQVHKTYAQKKYFTKVNGDCLWVIGLWMLNCLFPSNFLCFSELCLIGHANAFIMETPSHKLYF